MGLWQALIDFADADKFFLLARGFHLTGLIARVLRQVALITHNDAKYSSKGNVLRGCMCVQSLYWK